MLKALLNSFSSSVFNLKRESVDSSNPTAIVTVTINKGGIGIISVYFVSFHAISVCKA